MLDGTADFGHDGWTQSGEVCFRGHAVDPDGRPVDLADRYRGTASVEAVRETTRTLAGFFAVVRRTDDALFLVCDHARSVPLYFSTTTPVAVSDAASRIRPTDATVDPVAESEFLLTRYVTGGDTLHPTLKSVRAGEVVRVPLDRPAKFERNRSVTYRPTTARSDDRAAALDRLRSGLCTAVDRTVDAIDDRPVVVPLSGGLDSRLVAAALRERGLDVIGFTFGRRGHGDVEVSRSMAEVLDIDWEWVEYTPDRWVEWYHSEAYEGYCDFAFNLDGLPFLADWPAVKVLRDEGRIPPDAVVCPGHTVATPSERVPTAWLETAPTADDVVDGILERHYDLWEWDDDRAQRVLASRIREEAGLGTVASAGEAAAAYEQWEWSTRMAVFTHGDLRVFEWFDLDWWLPLWDRAYVAAWSKTPLELRLGKALQNDLARETVTRIAGIDRERVHRTDRDWTAVRQLRRTVDTAPLSTLEPGFDGWFGAQATPRAGWEQPGNHPLAWYGILPDDHAERYAGAKNLYALRTAAAAGRLSVSDPPDRVITPLIDLPLSERPDGDESL